MPKGLPSEAAHHSSKAFLGDRRLSQIPHGQMSDYGNRRVGRSAMPQVEPGSPARYTVKNPYLGRFGL